METEGNERRWATPVVRAMLKDNGLTETDLSKIEGTGEGGRVTKRDLEGYLAGGARSAAATPTPPVAAPPPAPKVPEPKAAAPTVAGPRPDARPARRDAEDDRGPHGSLLADPGGHDDHGVRRHRDGELPHSEQGLVPGDPRRQAHLHSLLHQGVGGVARRVPARQRRLYARRRPHDEGDQRRHRGRAWQEGRRGAYRPRDPGLRNEGPRPDRQGPGGDRGQGARKQARRRGREGRHLHPHQSRHLRRELRHPA